MLPLSNFQPCLCPSMHCRRGENTARSSPPSPAQSVKYWPAGIKSACLIMDQRRVGMACMIYKRPILCVTSQWLGIPGHSVAVAGCRLRFQQNKLSVEEGSRRSCCHFPTTNPVAAHQCTTAEAKIRPGALHLDHCTEYEILDNGKGKTSFPQISNSWKPCEYILPIPSAVGRERRSCCHFPTTNPVAAHHGTAAEAKTARGPQTQSCRECEILNNGYLIHGKLANISLRSHQLSVENVDHVATFQPPISSLPIKALKRRRKHSPGVCTQSCTECEILDDGSFIIDQPCYGGMNDLETVYSLYEISNSWQTLRIYPSDPISCRLRRARVDHVATFQPPILSLPIEAKTHPGALHPVLHGV
ncbi:hypothetical protein CDAR_380101 [Caerostris darwini]|uniref:Uncharacterized protein n=1 Tax=Caerostris darwini TaxID=1538125 RepID=A0AAV4WDA7_9ARAC|nr:hypothetical protein CDAR_380101 [Caerostris darwini]